MASRVRMLTSLLGSLCLGLVLVPVASAESPTLLWSTTAKTLTVGKAGKQYTVTAPGDSPTVWFTDRPDRNAGSTTLSGFVGGWEQNEFNKVPPNAALVLRRGGKVMQSVVVLTRPRELFNGSIQFRARILRKGDVMDMKTMDMALPRGRYRNAALFIDAGDTPACPAMITSPGWCTLQSTNDVGASTTVDLETPNKAGITRTIKTCHWKGTGYVGARLYYRDVVTNGREQNYTLNKESTTKCDTPNFANLNDSVWTFEPVNSYYANSSEVALTRNKRVVLTLNSRKVDWGQAWRVFSSPKAIIVVSDS